MSEWQRLRLGDLVSIKHGYAFKGEYFSDSARGPILVTPGNFAIGGGFKLGRLKSYLGPVPDEFLLDAGDLVITMTDLSKSGDTLGYPAIVPTDHQYLHNQRIGLVNVNVPDRIDARYLYFIMCSNVYRHHVLAGSTGSTVRHTSPSRISDYEFIAPDLSGQQAIAAVLAALDDKIAVNERIADKARMLAQLRFEAAAKTGSRVEVELSSIAVLISRGVTPRYSSDSEQLIVLNQKCVRDGRISLGPSRHTERATVPVHKLLRPDDVLVNSTGVGTLGRVALWESDYPATVDSHMTIVRVDPSKADSVCAGFALLASQEHIESLGQGSTGQTELNRAQLGALSLTLPDSDDARQLRPILDALEARGNAALNESATLEKLRNTLLPKLTSGAIEVRRAERIVEGAT